MAKKKSLQKSEKLEGYAHLLAEVRSILDKGLVKTYQAVDNIRVQTYWQVGERIFREELKHKDRADYGKRIVQQLAQDLGFSRTTMFAIVQFYHCYPIVQALLGQLSWSHFFALIRIANPKERRFYEVQIIKNSWSSLELEKRMKNKEYEKAIKVGKVSLTLPRKASGPEEIFKDTYAWDFLQLEDGHTEKDLEDGLVASIRDTLLEFGYGFAFMGQQVKIKVGKQHHYVDLLFYNREIPCLVVIELKTEKFKDEHVGQMNTYLNYFREHEKMPWEKDPIGLIICKEKDAEEVHYALGGLEEKIFVAEYKAALPLEKDIAKRLRKLRG